MIYYIIGIFIAIISGMFPLINQEIFLRLSITRQYILILGYLILFFVYYYISDII